LRPEPLHQPGKTGKAAMLLNDPLFIVAAIATLAVLAILMIGIGGFARGGDFNRKHANRIMRYRIIAQAIAVALIVLFVAVQKMRGS
jgi:hypothetical protein